MRRAGVALVVIVLFAALLYIGGRKVSLDQNTMLGTGCLIPAHVTAVSAAPDAAPGGGGIRVAETSSSGAVLENTSTQVAYRIPVGTVVVPLLTPGARIGVAEVGSVGQVTWLSPESLGGFTPVTATVVPGGVRYHSANCRALTSRGAAVLHRDAAGRIVGAERLSADRVSCAPGDRELPFTLGAGTEVYPYCDLVSG
ncbi:hypothetical protein OHS18_45830 [Amycolatopsis sp. NBC_00355]|uniref:hypothetical protein n=1 Tax=Amycolatopsis sp. NBC_00355 TaxID=2975957 RepID=UPI002E25DEC2